jgi:hypothetical protein
MYVRVAHVITATRVDLERLQTLLFDKCRVKPIVSGTGHGKSGLQALLKASKPCGILREGLGGPMLCTESDRGLE